MHLLKISPAGKNSLFAILVVIASAFASAQPTRSNGVATLLLQSKAVGSSYQLDGVVQPVKQSTVAAQASGRVSSLLVKAGDHVKAGQILAVIDDRETLVGVQRSQAQINQADAEVRNARANLERSRDLQGKGFVSKAALDSAVEQFNIASAARDQATAGSRQTALAQGFTRVTAPFDGWVMQTHVDAGDLAVPGHPIATIYAPQPLRVAVQVPGSRTQAVKTATQTRILLDDVQNGPSSFAPISKSSIPYSDPISQTTEWRFALAAKDAASLIPGQQVRLQFALEVQKSVVSKLTVPAASVVRRGELTAVYVATSGGFALRAVRTGASLPGNEVEILTGVQPGESIALDPIRAGLKDAKPLDLKK
jgi:RND family efflux transporter MFP subunit